MSEKEFTWRDGERTIHFRAGVVSDATAILGGHGFQGYELLTTERAMGAASVELAEDAACFHHVPPGPVNEVAARVIGDVGDGDLVALGGGRVIDVAKAIAAVKGGRVAALPTTLSGAEMTRIHRLPEGHEAPGGLVRPEVVIADPPLMVGLAEEHLRASAMNALAHGADSLYTPLANPVSEMTALRGAALIAKALDNERSKRDPAALALGSILCAYALDSALFSLHHVVCQTLVRELRIPHAETNATMLPRVVEALTPRAGKQMTALARALGTKQDGLRERVEELGGGPRRLSAIGAERDNLDAAVKAIMARPELQMTPDVPGEREIRALIESAW
ncbi:MAG: maleylacetate reductase [Solirubrobacterales bacterium]|jgi:alcohol dehydrogenase class IV|nr:maleylacetate reductase [Solirubrobacterales bacterium]